MRIAFVLASACVIAGCAIQLAQQRIGGERISQPGVSFVPPTTRSWSVLVASTYQISLLTSGSAANETYVVVAWAFPIARFNSREEFLSDVQRGRATEVLRERFEIIKDHQELDGQKKETCVKYQSASKDFGAKRGGAFTIYETYGMICIHPKDPQVGIRVELSRKAPPEVANQEFERLGDSLLKSVQFSEFR